MDVIHFAGHLAGEALSELEETCRGLKGPIVLELDQLRSTDREGLTTIAQLARAGAELTEVPPHVREFLKARDWANRGKARRGRS